MSAQYSQYDGTQRRGMVPPPPPPRFHNQQPLSFPTQQSHQQHAERRNNNRKPYSRGRDGRKYEEEMGGRNFFTDEEVNLFNTVDELRQEIAQLKQTEAEIKTRERLYNVIIDSYHESTVAANSQYATQWYNPTEKSIICNSNMLGIFSAKVLIVTKYSLRNSWPASMSFLIIKTHGCRPRCTPKYHVKHSSVAVHSILQLKASQKAIREINSWI